MNKSKLLIYSGVGAVGSAVINLLGGWDMSLQTLIGFMAADYLSGMVVAGIFHRSPKTDSGALSSKAGLKGLFRKGGMLLVVYVAAQLDLLTGTQYVRDAAVIALAANEAVSIFENLGLMGVPLPRVITQAVEELKRKEESDDEAGY